MFRITAKGRNTRTALLTQSALQKFAKNQVSTHHFAKEIRIQGYHQVITILIVVFNHLNFTVQFEENIARIAKSWPKNI